MVEWTSFLTKSRKNFKVLSVVLEIIIVHQHPNRQLAPTNLRNFSNYNLADPAFDKPSTIDLLLRQSVYTHILNSRNVKKETILLTDTVLGSIVSDAADTDHRITTRRHSSQFRIKLLDSQSIIFDSFWENEDILSSPNMHSSNEIECIWHCDRTTTYGSDGRAMLRLPINKSQGDLEQNQP